MRYVKWGFWTLVAALVLMFLHYTLPQHDIVRIVGTENRRIDVGENSIFWSRSEVGMAESTSRDVFFINAIYPDGSTMEYRNEDTGWGWPPYFKIDTFGLQTKAKELASPASAPIWVSVTHYGWRNGLFTIFPNAVEVTRVDGPDTRIIPWFNIVFFLFVAFLLYMIRKMWLQLRERTIDPVIAGAGEAWDNVDAKADAARAEARGFFARIGAWLNTWRSKKK
jgi:hypothetical protein